MSESTAKESKNQQAPPPMGGLKIWLSGFITGSISRTIVHPIDTGKARMQVIKSKLKFSDLRKTGLLNTLQNLYKAEGIKGLYRGLPFSCLAGGPASGLYFYIYDRSKKTLSRLTHTENSFLVGFTSGIIAESISCVLWVPIDVIKERLQVQSLLKTYKYEGSIDAVRQIHRQEGLRALYKAYGATLLTFGPFTGISLALYDLFKNKWAGPEGSLGLGQSFLMSSTAGLIASVVTNPLDVVKVRMQVQRAELAPGQRLEQGRFNYRNAFHGLGLLFKGEGVIGLFKGVVGRILFGASTSALHLSLNDFVKYRLLKNFDGRY